LDPHASPTKAGADIMIDLTERIEIDDMSLCPLCDQPILNYEEISIFSAHGMVGLIHKGCAEEQES
jgi:hypothetical protein